MNCTALWRVGLLLTPLLIAAACGDDKTATNTAAGGNDSTGGTASPSGGATNRGGSGGTSAAGTSVTAGGTSAAGAKSSLAGASALAGRAAAGSPSVAGSANVAGNAGFGNAEYVYLIKQTTAGTTSADIAGGVITVNSAYSASGNAFKYVAPNYYGTNSNGFIALPTPVTGDFSIEADVAITTQVKSNNACGIGLGMAAGFNASDAYAYMLMRNSVNSTNGYYVSGSATITTGAPTVAFTNGTPLHLSFSRTGTDVNYSAGPVGGTALTQTVATSAFTNGTTVYGSGSVYPAISFNNVIATISNLVIKDATGKTVYNSATGTVVTYIPAALSLSASTASMKKGASSSITATANANGGDISGVTAVAADPTIVAVTVTNGAANSTINLSGQKGGVTTVTITNTSDTNPVTNVKTLTVAVNDYPAADSYGSLATVAYPTPGAVAAYTDGELSLTFDSPPTLNASGSIKIFKQADGTEVDNVAFAGETQILAATTLNVGSQLARVAGNTIYFAPHVGKLAYGTAYYVGIPTHSITGTLNATAFDGLSDQSTVATWKFTTRAAPTLSATSITVDGAPASTANFRTLQAALNAAMGMSALNVTINVAAGTYYELLRFSGAVGSTQTIRIAGPAGNTKGDNCVVQWVNGNALNGTTQTRPSFYFAGANLILENITLKNTGVRSVVNQAETIFFANGSGGTTFAAYNSSFSSNQDTIQTSGRSWFYKCHIEGNTDFIWGTADASLFEACDLRVVAEASPTSSYSMLVARTGTTIAATASGTVGKGYVLLNSTVTVDATMNAMFARDAGVGAYYDQVALINVAFSGTGTIGAGLWNIGTSTPAAYTALGDGSYVGWKAVGCTGLGVDTLATAPGTSTTIADQAAEYDTRDHILNRVVTVTTGAPSGYEAATAVWDVSTLATTWGAP